MSAVNVCLRMPNIDTIIFYVIFIIIVPYIFISTDNIRALQYYFPALVMIAVTLTTAGSPKLFANLYQEEPDNVTAWMSKNFINLLAVTGVLASVISMTMINSSNYAQPLVAGIIAFAITFPIAQTVLPFFIKQGDEVLRRNTTFSFPGNWHKYFFGFAFIIFLWGLQYVSMIAVNGYLAN